MSRRYPDPGYDDRDDSRTVSSAAVFAEAHAFDERDIDPRPELDRLPRWQPRPWAEAS